MAKILVVDDEPALRRMLRSFAAMKGYEMAEAASVEEAEQVLKTERVDLILLDHVLPGKTGLQALPALGASSAAPIVMMSGDSGEGFRRDAELLGAKGVLAKPFELEELERTLARLIP